MDLAQHQIEHAGDEELDRAALEPVVDIELDIAGTVRLVEELPLAVEVLDRALRLMRLDD